MTTIELSRADQAFAMTATDANGHSIRMDAAAETGGHNSGVRPMQTLLMGLGGCSSVDILSILRKQKQDVQDFRITIRGERESGKEPALWKAVHLVFHFTGTVDPDKADKAIALSINKYCSVAATLRAAGCTISWETQINRVAP
ncbi:MAG: OsmC family protein [Chitinophagaceae bacterium]|nr:OsmC family protein [Chitinophagaceae bacterium]